MKIKAILVTGIFLISHLSHGQTNDPVKAANMSNEKKAAVKMVDKNIAAFLVKSADARMMGAQEGKLAVQKGTTKAVREYGALMVKDQTMLLKRIKALAANKKISLPLAIGEQKQDGKDDLMAKTGKEFDKKFMKMMKIDHERDVKLFKKATECSDPEVAAFAVKYLPVIEAHLNKVNKISVK